MKTILVIYLITCWIAFVVRSVYFHYEKQDRKKYNIYSLIYLSAGMEPSRALKTRYALESMMYVFFPVVNILSCTVQLLMIIIYKRINKAFEGR